MSITPLFGAQRRRTLTESLTAFFKVDHTIAAVLLVGASAEPKQDPYSGISMEVIVDARADFSLTYRKWRQNLPLMMTTHGQVEYFVAGSHATLSLLLEGYLELTLYFIGFSHLLMPSRLWKQPDGTARLVKIYNPAPKPWKLLYAQSSVEDKLAKIVNASEQSASRSAREIAYHEILRGIWQPIIHAVVALRRGEIWRAISRVDALRNQIIALAALNYEVDVHDYAAVDQLPEMLLISLSHTLPTGTGQVAVRRALVSALHLFFSEAQLLETKLNMESLSAPMKERLLAYVEGYA